jgi:hypothetical protein
MSATTAPEFIDILDRRIDQVLKYPGGWGGKDTLEPLVLMLLMLRSSVTDSDSNDRIVVGEYQKFLTERVGGGAADLRARLGEDCSEARMVEILREHVERVRDCPAPQSMASPLPEPPERALAGAENPVDIARPHYEHQRAS